MTEMEIAELIIELCGIVLLVIVLDYMNPRRKYYIFRKRRIILDEEEE